MQRADFPPVKSRGTLIMKRLLISIVAALAIPLTFSSSALINPAVTSAQTPEFMVTMLVTTESNEFVFAFCKGTLIQKYWVLSSRSCFNDHYKVFEKAVRDSRPVYYAYFEHNGETRLVEEYVVSPDGALALFRLKNPASSKPVKLVYKPTSELLSSTVNILGFETSDAIGDTLFNPAGNIPGICKVSGSVFTKSGTFCYIISLPDYTNQLKVSAGKVFDPAVDKTGLTIIDSLEEIDGTGTKIYVNFQASGSYPCAEDIGSALLVEQSDGWAQVGLVYGVGSVLALPICSMTILNTFLNLSKYEAFITATTSLSEPELTCPATPLFSFEKQGTNVVHLEWTRVSNATGYRALVTTSLGFEPIQAINLGDIDEIITAVDPSKTYTLAIQAYNNDCNGPMSVVRTISFSE